jgi:hypothetical protein
MIAPEKERIVCFCMDWWSNYLKSSDVSHVFCFGGFGPVWRAVRPPLPVFRFNGAKTRRKMKPKF